MSATQFFADRSALLATTNMALRGLVSYTEIRSLRCGARTTTAVPRTTTTIRWGCSGNMPMRRSCCSPT
jgi:hypothetical protein